MSYLSLFINPQTHLLRGGWRVLLFSVIALLPRIAAAMLVQPPAPAFSETKTATFFAVDLTMIIVYTALIVWVALVSWLCLRMFDGLSFASLGFALHQDWWRDALRGLTLSALMIFLVVLIQAAGGSTRLSYNQSFAGLSDWFGGLCLASLLLLVAAAFEEIVFRGYILQTLLRAVPAIVPIILLALLFGLAHWSNPSRTLFSTLNTVLAGIWLGVAYLKTRSLWFPTTLHFAWNWTMGLLFGLPVSGLIVRDSVFTTASLEPVWLTGGSYGPEGGLAATLVFGLAIMLIWRAQWLGISVQMAAAAKPSASDSEKPLKLGLNEPV